MDTPSPCRHFSTWGSTLARARRGTRVALQVIYSGGATQRTTVPNDQERDRDRKTRVRARVFAFTF